MGFGFCASINAFQKHLFPAPLLHIVLSIQNDVSFYYNADTFDSMQLSELKCSLSIYKYILATHAWNCL